MIVVISYGPLVSCYDFLGAGHSNPQNPWQPLQHLSAKCEATGSHRAPIMTSRKMDTQCEIPRHALAHCWCGNFWHSGFRLFQMPHARGMKEREMQGRPTGDRRIRPYADSLPQLCHIQGGRGGGWGRPGGGGGGPRTPTYMAQNDRLVALIILSHVCWGKKNLKKFVPYHGGPSHRNGATGWVRGGSYFFHNFHP